MSKCFFLMYVAARQGFEPQFLGPKPSVLPLDDQAIITITGGNVEHFTVKVSIIQAHVSCYNCSMPHNNYYLDLCIDVFVAHADARDLVPQGEASKNVKYRWCTQAELDVLLKEDERMRPEIHRCASRALEVISEMTIK